MLSWVLLGATFSCSISQRLERGTAVMYVRAIAPLPPVNEIEIKYLQQQGHISGLDWHGCEHWHVDGMLTIDVDQPSIDTVADIRACRDPGVGRSAVSGGYYALSGSRTVEAIHDGDCVSVIWQKSANEAYVVRAQACATGEKTGRLCNIIEAYTRKYDSKTRRYVWSFSASANQGFTIVYDPGQQPTIGAALRVVKPKPASGKSYTLDRVANNTCQPTVIPTPRQITSLITHELAHVVASAHVARYEALDELHANSFDSIMKFDGNMLLLFSKIGGIGRTTIQSMIDFAGSDMGLRDAASLWLSSQYGDRLSVSGLASLVKSIGDEFLTIRTHTVPWVEGACRRTLSLSDSERGVYGDGYLSSRIALKPKDYNAAMRILRNAYEWDWMPTLGNTWDAIPLSFVVDWFVNIGDIYESLDRLVSARYYDVVGVLNTVKVQATTTRCPSVVFTYYDREVSKSLRLSAASVQLGLPSIVNFINGAALFVGLN